MRVVVHAPLFSYFQVDPIKFPGGNEGMRQLTQDIRNMGYKWGSYTEASIK